MEYLIHVRLYFDGCNLMFYQFFNYYVFKNHHEIEITVYLFGKFLLTINDIICQQYLEVMTLWSTAKLQCFGRIIIIVNYVGNIEE